MRKYDFGLNWNGTIKEKFVELLQAACKEKKLSFLWISQDNVKKVAQDVERKHLTIKVLLDTEATYNKKGDPYARICYAVKDSGGIVINDPDRTKAAIDKSVLHYELVDAGIFTPYTVIVRNWHPNTYRLSDEDRQRLGTPFVIKPALGYGQQGVVMDARGSIREIASARNFDRGDNFLLQEKITPIELGGKRAWFRVFNLFNTIIPCWWDDVTSHYEHVPYEEFNSYGFYPLVKIVSKIASLTRMAWFSTEIAIDNKDNQKRFLTIDYINDQCAMDVQSETPCGVPDNIVKHTADCMVDVAHRHKHHEKFNRKYMVWLKDANIEIRGLGSAPELLKQTPSQKVSSHGKFVHKILQMLHPEQEEGKMKKKIVYTLIFVILVLFGKSAYCQYLSGQEKEIYYEIMRREYKLVRQNPDLMDRGDYYYTEQMEGNVHNVIARKYGLTIDQVWNIMERGLTREITAQEQRLMEKVSAETDSLPDDSYDEPEQMEEFMQEVARKYGTTFDVLCELERRMWHQMDWDDDDWDDEW